MKRQWMIWMGVALCFATHSTYAQLRLPALISDHMVLQQKSKVVLWGWSAPGSTIIISADWMKKPVTSTVLADSSWQQTITTTAAGGPYQLTIKNGTQQVSIQDVCLGEVWLASGQSNMEFFVGKLANPSYNGVLHYEQVIENANQPMIRMIDIPNNVADEPVKQVEAKWKVCSPPTVDTFSGVAYFFASDVQAHTGYPVGIINATWGGTPAESWVNKAILETDSVLSPILSRYEEQVAEYPKAHQRYLEALAKWKADSSKEKGSAPRDVMGPRHNQSPYKLYNGMIKPIEPYTLKGVIWYQGENNAGRAWQYRYLFPALINNWRKDWSDPSLPFYFVQISPHRSQNPEIREAQLMTYRRLKNTGIVVTTDNGDSLNIHPRNKKLVGERLARWALHNEYGEKKLVPSGPLYRSYRAEGNHLRIFFDFAQGLQAKDGPLDEFEIAGADSVFVPAQARIEGDEIVLWSDQVNKPIAARFAWRYIPQPHLYNGAGLPASPFRTDDWPGQTYNKK